MGVDTGAQGAPVPVLARVAGALLVLVGVANAALGVVSLASDAILLSAGASGGLLVVGLLTVGVGVMVAKGSRTATTGALAVFGLLLVLQGGDAVGGAGDDGASPRLLVLVGLVVSLVAARLAMRRPRGGRVTAGRRP